MRSCYYHNVTRFYREQLVILLTINSSFSHHFRGALPPLLPSQRRIASSYDPPDILRGKTPTPFFYYIFPFFQDEKITKTGDIIIFSLRIRRPILLSFERCVSGRVYSNASSNASHVYASHHILMPGGVRIPGV